MSDYRPSVLDIAKQRRADRLIEFWLRAFVAFILALAVVTLYYVVRHNQLSACFTCHTMLETPILLSLVLPRWADRAH